VTFCAALRVRRLGQLRDLTTCQCFGSEEDSDERGRDFEFTDGLMAPAVTMKGHLPMTGREGPFPFVSSNTLFLVR